MARSRVPRKVLQLAIIIKGVLYGNAPINMQVSVFYLSLIAFLISIVGGMYFLVWWIKSARQHQFLLYWAYSLGSLLWFKIPNILANAGVKIAQEEFYSFFFVTLLAYFLAYFALIRGFAFFTGFPRSKFVMTIFAIWFGAAIAYFTLGFLVRDIGVLYAPVWIGHLIFYIPEQLVVLYALRRAAKQPVQTFSVPRTSVALTAVGVVLLVMSSVFYVAVQVGPYPKEFWYFAVVSSSGISFTQIVSGLLLFFGLRGFAKSYMQTVPHGSEVLS